MWRSRQKSSSWGSQSPNLTFNQVHRGFGVRTVIVATLCLTGLALLGLGLVTAKLRGSSSLGARPTSGETDRSDGGAASSTVPDRRPSGSPRDCVDVDPLLAPLLCSAVLGDIVAAGATVSPTEVMPGVLNWGCPGKDIATGRAAQRVVVEAGGSELVYAAYQMKDRQQAELAIADLTEMGRACEAIVDDTFTYEVVDVPPEVPDGFIASLVGKPDHVEDCKPNNDVRDRWVRCRLDEIFFVVGDLVVQLYQYRAFDAAAEAEAVGALVELARSAQTIEVSD